MIQLFPPSDDNRGDASAAIAESDRGEDPDEATVVMLRVAAESEASEVRVKSHAEADARKALAEAESQGEREKVSIWTEAPSRVHLGLALQDLARNLPQIEHLNLTPDLVGDAVQKLLRDLASGD